MNSGIFKKIMVATDGSELVKRAIDTAVDIARQNEAKLYAVYVISMGFFFDDTSHRRAMESGISAAAHDRR